MKLTPVLAAVAVLGLGVGVAHANDRVGTVQSVHGRTFTLSDGNVYHLETNAAPESKAELTPGSKVRVTYEANAAANYVSDVQPVR
jgi:hypothetical protein